MNYESEMAQDHPVTFWMPIISKFAVPLHNLIDGGRSKWYLLLSCSGLSMEDCLVSTWVPLELFRRALESFCASILVRLGVTQGSSVGPVIGHILPCHILTYIDLDYPTCHILGWTASPWCYQPLFHFSFAVSVWLELHSEVAFLLYEKVWNELKFFQ